MVVALFKSIVIEDYWDDVGCDDSVIAALIISEWLLYMSLV